MSLGAIHQFHSGTARGDAITNQMLALQDRLRALGYFSEVYAQHIDEAFADRVWPLSEFVDMPATLLLVHHSMGHTAFDDLMELNVQMVTVFHSITPASFFDDTSMQAHIRLGFQQLQRLARRSSFGIAVSQHNRMQMYQAGFTSVEVMPVRTQFGAHRDVRAERTSRSHDWLFVGRVVPNKRQLDLVRAHSIHVRSGGLGQLHLVGDTVYTPYVNDVLRAIDQLGANDQVVVHGKVSERELLDRYRDAGYFVCLSEHEGFGVPLLEAMAAGVPVIARAGAAVTETMGGAGVLLTDGDPAALAAAVRLIDSDDELRHRLIHSQDRRLERIENFDLDHFIDRLDQRASGRLTSTSTQILGPFETSYSLAILNRELALALDEHDDLDVSIYATEGPGDYTPDPADLAEHPEAAELYERGRTMPYPEVAIRQMYPPRVSDSTAGLTFQYFGWEESRLPSRIVDDFNAHLDGIGTMSTYVKEILVDSGVTIPIHVTGVGVHAPDPRARCTVDGLSELRSTVFLHISSAFPRKGVDVLLRAYFETFSSADDVSLVLKTFPNPHNDVATILAALREEFSDPPHLCWIDQDVGREELDGLYNLATCYVHAARGEGFGLPVAEAMLADVPVIAVAATGLADFVSASTAAVIGHTIEPARTHLSVPGSEWVEPSLADLRRELDAAARGDEDELRRGRVRAARELIETHFTWKRVGERWHEFITDERRRHRGMSVASVSTFNSRCGIAEYTASLFESMDGRAVPYLLADDNVVPIDPDLEVLVDRVWTHDRRQTTDRLLAALSRSDADLVHIQHNFGFFTVAELGRIIRQEVPKRPTVATFHRTAPLAVGDGFEALGDIAEALRSLDAIIVHQETDRKRLDAIGVSGNVEVIPIGTEQHVEVEVEAARHRLRIPTTSFVIGVFGFLLPHKGMLTLLRSVAILRDHGIDARVIATCALHPDPSSPVHRDEVLGEIDRLGLQAVVNLDTDFLEINEIHRRLGAADVIVMPYDQTNESASAALRTVLPLGRALVASAITIFEDIENVVPTVPSPVDPTALAALLEDLWADPAGRDDVAARVRAHAEATSWSRAGARTLEIYSRALRRRADDESNATDA